MKRLTRPLDEYECRIETCYAEEWIRDLSEERKYPDAKRMCDTCPFMAIVNRLAEYEDLDERYEDDLK